MSTLTTNTFFGLPPVVQTPTSPSFTMPEPISYDFQVVEYVEKDKVVRVALQVRRNTHDQYGNLRLLGSWQDAPRVKVNL
jgi:hypothetical protein